MKTSYAYVNEIFKTLPIGYYLGRNIPITLVESEIRSYFDPSHDNIVIGYRLIEMALATMPDDVSDAEIEEIIRGLVYHELSHVILTPSDMKRHASGKKEADALNIMEDERIETLLRNTYMNTNFKKNIMLLNRFTGNAPKNAYDAFYQTVRYRIGEKSWIDKFVEIINKYNKINSNSDYYGYYSTVGYCNMLSDMLKYYHDFMCDYEEKHKYDDTKTEEPMEDTTEKGVEDSVDTTTSMSDDTDDDTDNGIEDIANDIDTEDISDNSVESIIDKLLEDIEDTDAESISIDKCEFVDISKEVINVYYDNNLESKIRDIIIRKTKKASQTGSAISSYSGRFNPRSVGRDDYKWWVQQNRVGHVRQFSKVHFNLWIDNSGSFGSNDEIMNTFIQTLNRINLSDFTFDVITINTRINEWSDTHKIFESEGGNCLTDDIKEVIVRHQKPNTNNVNIVLFDGDAHTDDGYYHWYNNSSRKNTYEPFKNFDMNNTIIISDYANEDYIEHANLTTAKVKFTNNYVEEFVDEVLNMIEKIA